MDFVDLRRRILTLDMSDEMLWPVLYGVENKPVAVNQSPTYGGVGIYFRTGAMWKNAGYNAPPGVTGYEFYWSDNTGEGGPWNFAKRQFVTPTVGYPFLVGFSSDSNSNVAPKINIPGLIAQAIKIVALTDEFPYPNLTLTLYGDIEYL